MRELSITYDRETGRFEARLVVAVKANPCPGTGTGVPLAWGEGDRHGDLTGIREIITEITP